MPFGTRISRGWCCPAWAQSGATPEFSGYCRSRVVRPRRGGRGVRCSIPTGDGPRSGGRGFGASHSRGLRRPTASDLFPAAGETSTSWATTSAMRASATRILASGCPRSASSWIRHPTATASLPPLSRDCRRSAMVATLWTWTSISRARWSASAVRDALPIRRGRMLRPARPSRRLPTSGRQRRRLSSPALKSPSEGPHLRATRPLRSRRTPVARMLSAYTDRRSCCPVGYASHQPHRPGNAFARGRATGPFGGSEPAPSAEGCRRVSRRHPCPGRPPMSPASGAVSA